MIVRLKSLVGNACVVASVLAGACSLQAGVLYVPNASFESPGAPSDTPYATPDLDQWQKSPGSDFLAGSFTNVTIPGQHIDNCDGNNGAFLFANPGVALFQDYNTVYGTNVTPNHAFNSKFNVGHAY